MASQRKYMSGFGAELQSEAKPGALPIGVNNPQKCPFGLFAEQLSGTSFTTPRCHNRRSWFYRILPSVCHSPLQPVVQDTYKLWKSYFHDAQIVPNQLRWPPAVFAPKNTAVTFAAGIKTVAGAGGPDLKIGVAIHIFVANTSMVDEAICNSDGDMLIIPESGNITVQTEFGILDVAIGEIIVVPRGVRFAVMFQDQNVRGYICEVYGGHFQLPELGPIGANGLANARDFLHPVAHYECEPPKSHKFTILQKFMGKFFTMEQKHSCFDVVAWHGNYLPFKYNLDRFCAVNSVTFDHMDPSIFTVLTVPSSEPGVAAMDFVIFPPRWQVQDGFRPPYFHRNAPMSEFMGNIRGQYEAKPTG
eukprot:CRZ02700.1 hypothetical protein [Spongospora subterranea]